VLISRAAAVDVYTKEEIDNLNISSNNNSTTS
jgi:hypothetical protein